MHHYLIRLILSVCICLSGTAVFAQVRYQVTEIPDEVYAQLLTHKGEVLGLDWTSGTAVLWSTDSGITTIPSPDGYKWNMVNVSPGGRFIGATVMPDNTRTYYEGQLSGELSLVTWPTSLKLVASQGASSSGVVAGAVIICTGGDCAPVVLPPPYVPRPPNFTANAINDEGVIAGVLSIDRNSTNSIRSPEIHAFRLYPDGRMDLMENIGLLAKSINRKGYALVSPMLVCRMDSLLWTTDGQLLRPDPLPGYEFLDNPVINDLGEIAGTTTNEKHVDSLNATGNLQGFRWTPGKGTIALDLLSGFSSAVVHGSNNMEKAVGEATNNNSFCGISIYDPSAPSSVAVVWGRDGQVDDLNTAIIKENRHHSSHLELLTAAQAINDDGQILASGFDSSNKVHSYFLRPIRELHSNEDKRHRHGDNDDSKEDKDNRKHLR